MSNTKVVDKYNYGLALVKIFMCFEVVCCHYWWYWAMPQIPAYLRIFSDFALTAVPFFMLTSFFLCEKQFEDTTGASFEKRIFRLVLPFIVWNVVYFIIYSVVQHFTSVDLGVSFTSLRRQMFFGSVTELNPPMWFQFNLIILTIVFFVLYKHMNKKMLVSVLTIALVLSYVIQYSSVYSKFFGQSSAEIKNSPGRLVMMLPFAIVGIFIAYAKPKIDANRKYWFYLGLLSVVSQIFILMVEQYDRPNCSQYGGILLMFKALSVFILAYTLPCWHFHPVVKKIIKSVASCSYGVYFLHFGIGFAMNAFLSSKGLEVNTFAECVVIFILSYLICFLVSKLPIRYSKELVG